jgi:hypothetical protein
MRGKELRRSSVYPVFGGGSGCAVAVVPRKGVAAKRMIQDEDRRIARGHTTFEARIAPLAYRFGYWGRTVTTTGVWSLGRSMPRGSLST